MKKANFYLSSEAFRMLSLALAFRRAAVTASIYNSNPWLINHFRMCMRMYALDAVSSAKREAAK